MSIDENLESWRVLKNFFEKEYLKEGYGGICILASELRRLRIISLMQYYSLINEIEYDLYADGKMRSFLFPSGDYKSRLEYINGKIEKYEQE